MRHDDHQRVSLILVTPSSSTERGGKPAPMGATPAQLAAPGLPTGEGLSSIFTG